MPVDSTDPLTAKQLLTSQPKKTQPTLTPAQAARLSQIKVRAGWVPPDQQLALARANATDDAVDAVANMNAKQIVDLQASEEDEGGWFRRNVYDRFKATSRWTMAGLNFVPETAQGAFAQLFDDNKDVDGWFISTSLGTMIENPELRGEGYFLSEKGMEKQAERARRYRGTVNGSAWTVGRGAANIVFKEDTKPYSIMSGVLDALVMIKADPTTPVTKGVKAFTEVGSASRLGKVVTKVTGKEFLGNIVPLVSDDAAKVLREQMQTDIGLTRGLAESVLDGTKYDEFSRTNGRMVEFINRLTKEKSPLAIIEKHFNGAPIPNELAVALANTNDPEVVRGLLATGWSVARGALPEDIRVLQGTVMKSKVGNFVVERMPLVDNIRKNRYMRQFQSTVDRFTTPMEKGAIVVHGTQEDNAQAVRSIVAYMRTAGVDADTIETVANQAVRDFSPLGTDAARRATTDTFHSVLRQVMRKDGIPEESIDELFARGTGAIDKIRRYMLDRIGKPFDSGYTSYLLNKNRDFVPDEMIDVLLKDLGVTNTQGLAIVSPTELVEMLDRTIILPDLREVRRFTRNPLFRDLLSGTEIKKMPITSKRKLKLVEVITDKKRYDEITGRLNEIRERNVAIEQLKKNGLPFDTDETRALGRETVALQEEAASLKVKEPRRVITPDQRALLTGVEFVQNQLWKPLALATGGYMVRNSLDAQVRMLFSDLPSLLSHPFEYLNLVLGSSKKMTLRLENIANGKFLKEEAVTVDDLLKDVREAMEFGPRQQGIELFESRMKPSGSFAGVSRQGDGISMHTDGVVQQGRRSVNDTLRKVVNQTFVEYGKGAASRDAAVERVVNVILKNDEIRKEIDDLHRSGFLVRSQDGRGTVRTNPIDLSALSKDEAKQAYRQYAYRIVVDNQQIMTGDIPEMRFMYAFGYAPITKEGKMVGAFEAQIDDLLSIPQGEAKKVGSIVQLGDDQIGVITKLRDADGAVVIDPFDGTVVEFENAVATVQPVHPDRAFDSAKGSREARQLIETMPTTADGSIDGLPEVTKREIMIGDPKDETLWGNIQDSYDRTMNLFFGTIYGTASRKLERSPVFREFYYRAVADHIDRLRPEDAQKFLDDVAKAAKEAEMSPAKYVGSKDLIRRIEETAKTGGDVSLEDLDGFAKFRALTETKDLLYDVSSKSNLEDILRVIMPFAPAWKEVIGTYAGFMLKNPIGTSRSFQRVYQGIGNADPDNNGRGFFYKDPQTDQMMFAFPGSGTLAKALTGLDATLEAPVKRLSQGIQGFPSLGPMAQVAYSKVAPYVPNADFFTGLLLPYGTKGLSTAFNPTPQWINKGFQAFTAPERDTETIYFNTWAETVRAMSASGKYDLSSKAELQQLQEDARFNARILTGLRAASQFFGPTAGSTEFNIPTEQGDVFVGELIKAFYDMQADPQVGYDGAVPKFLETFGDEAALYVASKTRSVQEGLEATKEFQDWAEGNQGIIKEYENVARYLAPAGSDFSFAVWNLQVAKGERVRLTVPEIIELAQRRIGSSLYADARRQVGPYPSEDARAVLARYRTFLHNKYPGFPENAEFTVGQFYNDLGDLKDLVQDPRVANNETAIAVKTYLSARDAAIARSGVSEEGFKTAKSAAPLRAGLESIGVSLIDQYPNFARIWERLLASEVE